jgi:hypothetical protein
VPASASAGDDLALSGRGKTAHAVITRTDEKLTDDERDALMRLATV